MNTGFMFLSSSAMTTPSVSGLSAEMVKFAIILAVGVSLVCLILAIVSSVLFKRNSMFVASAVFLALNPVYVFVAAFLFKVVPIMFVVNVDQSFNEDLIIAVFIGALIVGMTQALMKILVNSLVKLDS